MRTATWWRVIAAGVACIALAGAGCGRDEGGGGGGGGGGDATGVTQDTIKLGTSFPLSGPASAYSTISRAQKAYFEWVNSKGGVNGRKIEYTVLDDAYEPPRAVNNARRLITQEKVFALFNVLGTPPNLAIWDYVNQQKVPHLFVATGAPEWGADVDAHPFTIGWQPDYVTEAVAQADYLKREKPNAKVAVLYQNDDFGKGFLEGFEGKIEGSQVRIVARESYEVTDPTVAPQVTKLAGSGADTFVNISTPKPAAQAIGTVAKSDWKPMHLISNVASSKELVFKPVGLEAAKGILATIYTKEPDAQEFADDPAMREYKEQLKKYCSKCNVNEPFNVFGWATAYTMVETLKKAGEDLTRESIMDAARSLDLEVPLLLPGIKIKTGEGDGYPIESVQVAEFNGESWELQGDVYSNEGREQSGDIAGGQ
jgi:branched-chain amino acid transport system substrate-binding protein